MTEEGSRAIGRLLSEKSSMVYERLFSQKDFHDLRQESIILALQALKIAVVFNRINEDERKILHGRMINGEPFDTFILNKLSLAERISLEGIAVEVTLPEEMLNSTTADILEINKEIQDLNAETLALKRQLSSSSEGSARSLSGSLEHHSTPWWRTFSSGSNFSDGKEQKVAADESEVKNVTSEEQKDTTSDELQVGEKRPNDEVPGLFVPVFCCQVCHMTADTSFGLPTAALTDFQSSGVLCQTSTEDKHFLCAQCFQSFVVMTVNGYMKNTFQASGWNGKLKLLTYLAY